MSEPKFKDDYTHPEGRENGISGSLVPSETGYRHAIFTPTTLELIEKTFTQHIDTTLKDYQRIDERRALNLDAYEGKATKGGKDETITIPVVKRDANQQLAWLLYTLFAADPIISVRPLEAGHVTLVVESADGSLKEEVVTTDEEALALQELTNYYLNDRIGFKKIIRTWITELLRDGSRPPLLKIVHEPRERTVAMMNLVRNPENNRIEKIEKDPVYQTVKGGDATRIEVVPGDKFFIALPEWDIERAPFVFQEFEEDTATIKDKIARKVYDFCSEKIDEEALELVLSGLDKPEEGKRPRIDGRIPTDPIKKHILEELWFDYPFAQQATDELGQPVMNAKGEAQIDVTMVPFCAVRHRASKKWLNCYENFYWNRRRPFFAGRMQERPFSFSGYSTAENCGPFQRLISQLFHAQIQNLSIQNVKMFFVRKDSSSFRFLNPQSGQKPKLRPGLVVPFDDPTDINPQPLGSQIGSLEKEIAFLNSENEKMTVVNEFDRGKLPDRAAVGAINAVQSVAKMQPAMILDLIRETMGDAVKFFVQVLIQFSPTGISIPFKDAKTASLIKKVISFPQELIVDQFAFEVTATAEDETPQALTTRDLMLNGELRKFNQDFLAVSGVSWMPKTPPPIMTVGTQMIVGLRRMMARILKHSKLNPDDFLPKEEDIRAVPQQLLAIQGMMQQVGEMMGEEDEGQVQPTIPGGAIPGGEGQPAGMGPMGGESGNPEGFAGGEPGAIPPPVGSIQ